MRTNKFVVAVEIEAVIPADDPSGPSFEVETVQMRREVQEHAEQGDV